jgi:hypothetical protein
LYFVLDLWSEIQVKFILVKIIVNKTVKNIIMSRSIKTIGLIMFIMITIVVPLKLSAQVKGMAATMAVDGYVVLSNGDTLQGLIKWSLKYVENNPVEIKFTARNGATKIFNASEIRGFGNYMKAVKKDFDTPEELELDNYVSMPSMKKGVPVFLNRLMDGKLIIFQNRSSLGFSSEKVEEHSKIDGISFNFTPGEGLYIGPAYRTSYRIIEGRTRYSSYFVSKANGALLKVEKENYDSLFPSLFGDCPGIEQELLKNPDLRKFKNFTILAEVYNQICK